VAVEEEAVGLDDPAGPPGATVRHLLAHAAGLGPDGAVLAAPGTRRNYSNAGYEVLADVVAGATGLPFVTYLAEAVLVPLELTGTRLDGSPAAGAVGPVEDLLRLGGELLVPTLVAPATLAEATTVAFPGLAGVLPGFGRQDPNDSGPSCGATRRRTGRAPATRPGPSATSARPAASCGSTPTPGWRAAASPTGPSGPGRPRPGRSSRTRCWPRPAASPAGRRGPCTPGSG
jgi:CubicO group peptidase (beta-lactamase class C family)